MLVLDTNIVSGLMHPRPEAPFLRWMEAHSSASLYTTTVTQAEILYGLALMADGRRKSQLAIRITEMFALDFAGRILPFDSASAAFYAQFANERRRLGRPISPLDAQIAAITRAAAANLVTRNTRDFEGLGLTLHNPWDF